jgi:hypothetical protein
MELREAVGAGSAEDTSMAGGCGVFDPEPVSKSVGSIAAKHAQMEKMTT